MIVKTKRNQMKVGDMMMVKAIAPTNITFHQAINDETAPPAITAKDTIDNVATATTATFIDGGVYNFYINSNATSGVTSNKFFENEE